MQENKDKQLETLIGKVMKKASLETPSQDFTTNVMSQVLAVKRKPSIIYKPVISKATWLIILSVIAVLVVYILAQSKPDNSAWLNTINFSFLSNNIFSKTVSEISYSSTTIYVLLSLTIMICAQLILLKRYFDTQLEA